jgi:hypothetical protein
MSGPGPLVFAVFRVALGALVVAQVASFWPHAAELFARGGLGEVAPVGVAPLFPNPLALADDPWAVRLFLALLVGLGLALALGVARRAAAVALWYGWTCLGHADPFVQTVASAFVGWLLLASALVPPGEPLRPFGRARAGGGEVPRMLVVGGWVVLAVGYGLSGLDKLGSPGWREGEALRAAVGLPYARAWSAELLLALPDPVARAATWAGLGVELAFPAFALWRRTRPLAWAAGAALQLGLLGLFAFPGLTVGMLLMHLFLFDARWLSRAGLAPGGGRPERAGAQPAAGLPATKR